MHKLIRKIRIFRLLKFSDSSSHHLIIPQHQTHPPGGGSNVGLNNGPTGDPPYPSSTSSSSNSSSSTAAAVSNNKYNHSAESSTLFSNHHPRSQANQYSTMPIMGGVGKAAGAGRRAEGRVYQTTTLSTFGHHRGNSEKPNVY